MYPNNQTRNTNDDSDAAEVIALMQIMFNL